MRLPPLMMFGCPPQPVIDAAPQFPGPRCNVAGSTTVSARAGMDHSTMTAAPPPNSRENALATRRILSSSPLPQSTRTILARIMMAYLPGHFFLPRDELAESFL